MVMYKRVPSRLTAAPCGLFNPPVMVAVIAFVVVLTTDTELLLTFVTYRRLESGLIAKPEDPLKPEIVATTVLVVVSITDTVEGYRLLT